jgi:hypothetical protein
MRSRGNPDGGGLTALDAAKIIGAIVLVVVLLKVLGAIVGAIMSVVWGILIAVAVLASAWVLWNLVRGDPRT